MLLSDLLIKNYKLYLDGEPKSKEELTSILHKYFYTPCLTRIQKKLVPNQKEKILVDELKRIANATYFLADKTPYFKKNWFTKFLYSAFYKDAYISKLLIKAGYNDQA